MDHQQPDRNAAMFWVLALCTYLILPGAYAQNANPSEGVVEGRGASMRESDLTETEKRVLARTEEWRKEGSTPGGDLGRLVNEIYAESTEVFLPLNTPPLYVVERGESKENWHTLELSGRGHAYNRRVLNHVNTVVQGNRIAAEVVVDRVSPDGQPFEQRVAIFLTFDNDGKVITDHTYAGTSNFEALIPHLPEDGQKALKAIIENQ
jgi:ketosteroid isomerase-like protein